MHGHMNVKFVFTFANKVQSTECVCVCVCVCVRVRAAREVPKCMFYFMACLTTPLVASNGR